MLFYGLQSRWKRAELKKYENATPLCFFHFALHIYMCVCIYVYVCIYIKYADCQSSSWVPNLFWEKAVKKSEPPKRPLESSVSIPLSNPFELEFAEKYNLIHDEIHVNPKITT